MASRRTNSAKKASGSTTSSEKLYGTGPVRYSFSPGAGNPLKIGIDFRYAVPPGAYSYADATSLKRDRELATAVLSFGRYDPIGSRLTDRIDVVMPEGALFFQFWNSSRAVEKTLDEQLDTMKLGPVNRQIKSKTRPKATFYANVIFVTTGGGESCLDFYYLPVRDVNLAREKQADISLEPIVRILLSPVILKYLFELCRPHANASEVASTQLGRTEHASAS